MQRYLEKHQLVYIYETSEPFSEKGLIISIFALPSLHMVAPLYTKDERCFGHLCGMG